MLLAIAGIAQSDITGYEWWIDGDFGNRTFVAVAPTSTLELSQDLNTTLNPGNHFLGIRFYREDSTWSVPSTHLFRPHVAGATQIEAVEYWFDNQLDQSVIVPLPASPIVSSTLQIPATGIAAPLSNFSARFVDDLGQPGVPWQSLYLKGPGESNHIHRIRYWFNGDSALSTDSLIQDESNPLTFVADLLTSPLPQALGHSISVQFEDDLGQWTQIYTANFNKILGCWGDITGDGAIDTLDLLAFLGNFGCSDNCSDGDLNFDGQVNSLDLLLFLALYNTSC